MAFALMTCNVKEGGLSPWWRILVCLPDDLLFANIPVLIFADCADGKFNVAGHKGKKYLAPLDEPRVLRMGAD